MLFHPIFACPNCKLPLGLAIIRLYDENAKVADPDDFELRAACLWGCNYEQKFDDLAKAVITEGPRLCLDCGQVHVKDAEGSYCPNHRMQKENS